MADTTKTSKPEWEISQLQRTRLFPDEGDKRYSEVVSRSAVPALVQAKPAGRKQMVIRGYTSGEISIGKAAEMMGISHEEIKEIMTEGGAKIHLGP
ncbi:MAG: UPF0175 family protein, partial [Anaerolineae bacterium]|nr:UPF0175 family protein [Anaerolineae bacterium]